MVLFGVRSYIHAGSCLFCDEVADKCKNGVKMGRL